ncbi:MAG TPA: transaldolase [Lentimicrobium sp.]|nr:transaldolase [Bacteroidales bacterium]HLO92318.1 transaldolase [Lentimicrobium sp.]
MNTLIELLNYGQSYWLDNLTRDKITSGELEKRVKEQGLRGITSNPSIFNKAITESDSYDDQIRSLSSQGNTPEQIYEALTVKDVRDACDILRPVFDSSSGIDGFVSLEVSPHLARDTKGTIDEVHRLYSAVGRPNCYIKIPGTAEGIPAIEQMLYEGIPINITLLFSIERYTEVAEAYIRAVSRRVKEGLPVNKLVSVASFFVSRIDVLIDQLLRKNPSSNTKDVPNPQSLIGKAGVASARLAYKRFKELFSTDLWKQLEMNGARVQRPLWASTGNKDPLFYDLRYVETLIGPDTVNTLPDETITALADHGKLRRNSIEEELNESHQLFVWLYDYGIDMTAITKQLEEEGIVKFNDAYDKLIDSLAKIKVKIS